jgi:hypothetical protein
MPPTWKPRDSIIVRSTPRARSLSVSRYRIISYEAAHTFAAELSPAMLYMSICRRWCGVVQVQERDCKHTDHSAEEDQPGSILATSHATAMQGVQQSR